MSARLPLQPGVRGWGTFSECGTYRYALTREWDDRPRLVTIGLNPSTATADLDDPTIRAEIDFARRWNCGGLVKLNLFAYRATNPDDMWAAADPIGPGNDAAIAEAVASAPQVLCCWGDGKATTTARREALRERVQGVLHLLRLTDKVCLGLTAAGNPKHPLYLPRTTALQRWYPWARFRRDGQGHRP